MQSQSVFFVLEDSHDVRSGDGDLLQLNSNRYPRTTHEEFTRVYGIELPQNIPMLFWEFEKEKRTPFPVSSVKRWGRIFPAIVPRVGLRIDLALGL